MPTIISGSDMRATPPSLRMSAGTRSSAMTDTAPAASAILASSGVTTSMITPPLSISASPVLTRRVAVSFTETTLAARAPQPTSINARLCLAKRRGNHPNRMTTRALPAHTIARPMTRERRCTLLVVTVALALTAASSDAFASVNYGPISHKNMKDKGSASGGLKLSLQVGLIANQSGIQSAVKAASSPTSSTYGQYLSLSTLQKKYGASSSKSNGVINAFKKYGVTAKLDVTHLRVGATISIKNAQKLFSTSWHLYETNGETIALPVNTPKLPSGMSGNVDTVAGVRLTVNSSASSATAG